MGNERIYMPGQDVCRRELSSVTGMIFYNTARADYDAPRWYQRHEDAEAIGAQLRQVFGAPSAEEDGDEYVGAPPTVAGGGNECTVAATMVVVGMGAFVDPLMLVEVKVDAVVL
jgi:hypothetical protein